MDDLKTKNIIYYKDSSNMKEILDESINLIVTSPPYPLIEMWDNIFLNDKVKESIKEKNIFDTVKKSNSILFPIWEECIRVLNDCGMIAINVGDAYRTFDKNFVYYPNSAIITNFMMENGLIPLPPIHWRKPSNKPNKFMGSGMLPTSAYVTVEEEMILLFKKGKKRNFISGDINRQQSAYFWEERNCWFSDKWEILGTSQLIDKKFQTRNRNASYPLEIPTRLINMFSVYGDTILDPFSGTGTTTMASILCGRNSISYELDIQFMDITKDKIGVDVKSASISYCDKRISNHNNFISNRDCKYNNKNYRCKVVTNQEKNILFKVVENFTTNHMELVQSWDVSYSNYTIKE